MKKLKMAAVHAAPVFMNKTATLDKVLTIIQQASEQGVELLVFPEVFVPGYPGFIMGYPPLQYFATMVEYAKQSVAVFEPESVRSGKPQVSKDLLPIMDACAKSGIDVVLGISERASFSAETLFNSQVFISNTGKIIGVHRKLVPTYSERSVWAHGGGATLRCWDMQSKNGAQFKIGGLCCGENLNNGAKLAYVKEGQQVHAASWPGQCGFQELEGSWTTIKLLAQSHSTCAMCFTVCASSILSEAELNWNKETFGQESQYLIPGSGWSGIVGPNGEVLAEENAGLDDRLVVAEGYLDLISLSKFMNDPAGHYARTEVLNLEVNRKAIWDDDAVVASPALQE